MAARTISVSLPEAIIKRVDRKAKKEHRSRSDIVREALEAYLARPGDDAAWRQELVLALLRNATISADQAAGLLGISRLDVFDVMAEQSIPMADGDAESLRKEVETLRKVSGGKRQSRWPSVRVPGVRPAAA